MGKIKKGPIRDVFEIVMAFAVAFLFYQGLALVTGTSMPIVSVVSDSMYHAQHFDGWWESHNSFYSGYNMTKCNFRSFILANGLSRGDLLFVVKPENLKPGDIIIYQRGAEKFTIVHRVIAVDGDTYTTKGDNNMWPDKPDVSKEQIAGKVLFAVPLLGYPRLVLYAFGI